MLIWYHTEAYYAAVNHRWYSTISSMSQQKHVQYIIIYMYVIVNNFTISSHHPAGRHSLTYCRHVYYIVLEEIPTKNTSACMHGISCCPSVAIWRDCVYSWFTIAYTCTILCILHRYGVHVTILLSIHSVHSNWKYTQLLQYTVCNYWTIVAEGELFWFVVSQSSRLFHYKLQTYRVNRIRLAVEKQATSHPIQKVWTRL